MYDEDHCPAALDTPNMRFALECGFGRAADARAATAERMATPADLALDIITQGVSAHDAIHIALAATAPPADYRPSRLRRVWRAVQEAFQASPPPLA
jgi:hypothetical protein